MDIVYVKGGTVAAVVVGKTEDGHPVVVELGKPSVLKPIEGGADHNPEVHGYSYDVASEPTV